MRHIPSLDDTNFHDVRIHEDICIFDTDAALLEDETGTTYSNYFHGGPL